MKWFNKEPKPIEKDESIGNFVPLDKNANMINVKAIGSYSVDVEEKEQRYDFEHPYDIIFKYNFEVEFIGKKIKSKGRIFYNANDGVNGRRFYGYSSNHKEQAYEYLIKLLSERQNIIMENFEKRIKYDIQEYIKNERIDELKEIIKKNNSFEINMSFQMENPKK